jgi:hypothetical protein
MKIRTLILTLFLAASIVPQPKSAMLHIYVSLKGNDSWSGKLSEPNDDKNDGPFQTLERSRDGIAINISSCWHSHTRDLKQYSQ